MWCREDTYFFVALQAFLLFFSQEISLGQWIQEKCHIWAKNTICLSLNSWQNLWLVHRRGLISPVASWMSSGICWACIWADCIIFSSLGKVILSLNTCILEGTGRWKYISTETDAWGLIPSKYEHCFLHFAPLPHTCIASARQQVTR